MKRRTNPLKRSGTSPYQKYGKREYSYPEWVKQKRNPPREIQESIEAFARAARAAEIAEQRARAQQRRNDRGTSTN